VVYDWLTKRGIRWRVYHEGIPFFTLMPSWIGPILFDDEHFRSFDQLEEDLAGTPPDDLPQVIFVEPTYQDSPHLGFATDEHAPSGVSNGQEFLMRVYNAVTTSPSFWQGAVLVVDYDEHGGFFDHVSPPPIPTEPPQPGLYPRFETLGVRVPAYVISPFVKPGTVSNSLLDHTSVLKLLGEKFDPAGSYSSVVDARPVESVSAVLSFDQMVVDPPSVPAMDAYLAKRPAAAPLTVPEPNTMLQKAFSEAVANMRQQGAGPDHKKFGPLLQKMNEAGK
jgi:phospholipase C